jgi:hypothetical protein
MAKVKLSEKQLKRGKSELEGGFKNASEKLSNAKKMMFSGKREVKAAAKKTLKEQTERKNEIDELQKIFEKALKSIKSTAELEADKRAKSAATKSETERVKRDIKKLNAAGKKIDVELSELEIKIIVASLKRSENAVKRGKINATGAEYLKRLIKDFENLI